MKNTVMATVIILAFIEGLRRADSLICQTSLCVMHKNPEYDCRRRYLAAYIQCGSNEEVCTKILIFNTTAMKTSVETRQQILVSRSPLISVKRGCDRNSQEWEVNTCEHVPGLSSPYDGYICLCDTDYCNRGFRFKAKSYYIIVIIALNFCMIATKMLFKAI